MCCLALEKCGALDAIEQLQDHSNELVYESAFNFIARYFNDAVCVIFLFNVIMILTI